MTHTKNSLTHIIVLLFLPHSLTSYAHIFSLSLSLSLTFVITGNVSNFCMFQSSLYPLVIYLYEHLFYLNVPPRYFTLLLNMYSPPFYVHFFEQNEYNW
jgi:hypothetical protein